MGRKYKKVEGKKHRNRVNVEHLKEAIEDVKKGMSLGAAGKKYNIPKSVLQRRTANQTDNTHPGIVSAVPPALEKMLANRLAVCADWGYPFKMKEIQTLIGDYLEVNAIEITRFKNNVPGLDYVRGFLERHNDQLATRLASNIKRERTRAIDFDCLRSFFTNISSDLSNVPPKNIFKYHETNLTDDTGAQRVAGRRSTSKASTSVMFAASAANELLPPYVVYVRGCP